MELSYAENFKVEYYKGGYTMLTTMMDENRFLLVPEGKTAPKELEEDIVVLQKPIKDIYLSASAAMDMFAGLDGLDAISFSSQEEDGWYVEAAKEAMQKGEIVYGGKYSEPDYELLLSKGCSLALENRMITHAPEVVEKLESLGIPVMLEYSTYESHPLGRVEWVKFFGALLGKEEKAEQIFSEQEKILEEVSATEKTEKTVAFFYVTSNGLIQVRTPSDYIPKMIELAGGNYIFANLDAEEGKSTMNLQVEEFYSQAKDADFLIYNSSIDGGVSDIEALLGKCENLKDFKAVKEGKVWCTTNDMYQQSLSIGYLIEDMQKMLSEDENASMNYLFRLE
jgi:iron complex transport system substrate-binding protein